MKRIRKSPEDRMVALRYICGVGGVWFTVLSIVGFFYDPNFLQGVMLAAYGCVGLYFLAAALGLVTLRQVPLDRKGRPAEIQVPRRARVLVVDDDPAVTMAIRETIQQAGHACLVAGSSKEAFALCRGKRLDLMFIDSLPGGSSGMDVVQELNEANNFVRPMHVILLTDAPTPDLQAALGDGVIDGYLEKPPTHEGVKSALARCLLELPELVGA